MLLWQRRRLHSCLISAMLVTALGCGGVELEVEEFEVPLTGSGTYKALKASLTGPATAKPNTAFTLTANGSITGGASFDVHSYAIYENATWSYTSGHMVKVTAGKSLAASGFNWGNTLTKTLSLKRAAGTYKYTLVFGYRSGAHNWYDLAVDVTVKVAAAVSPFGYKVFGRHSDTLSKAGPSRYTFVQLTPTKAGNYWGNIKVTHDQADKVQAISIEENPFGSGMWNWWTSATADPTKGSTGTQYMYSDGGGQWAKTWIAKGDGNGKPGSIDKGTGAVGSKGHLFMYTSGSTKVTGFKPLRLGFKLKKGVNAPVTVTFEVRNNALTSFKWHAAALSGPQVYKVTIKPMAHLNAKVDCKPDALKLKKKKVKRKWFKCYIELPKTKLAVLRIRPKTVTLNGTVKAVPWWGKIGDYDKDGHYDMQVKFNYADVVKLLKPGNQTLTVAGKLWVRTFSGTDTVKVK